MARALIALVVAAGFVSCSACLIRALGAAFTGEPERMQDLISPEARALIHRAYRGIDPDRLVDHHTHTVGLGTGGTGAWVNPDMQSWLSPVRLAKFTVYAEASGIENFDNADAEYIERLKDLILTHAHPARHHMLAFDYFYLPDGTRVLEKSEFYIPNEYVFELAQRHPDLFVPVMSVHPYRDDALEELTRFAERGGRFLKWLPNAMGMDPADPGIDPFYARMRELGVTLMSHAGIEKAVEAEQDQTLGNPLRLRRALDAGVQVLVSHCASLGDMMDLDAEDPEAADLVPAFELFLRLMDEPRYEGLVFGEISGMTQANRLPDALDGLLRRTDLHHRLVNGSDYPLPAINVIIRTGALESDGFITGDERLQLNEIYDYNPLLFDFVVKRTVRAPGTDIGLPASAFYEHPPPPSTVGPPHGADVTGSD